MDSGITTSALVKDGMRPHSNRDTKGILSNEYMVRSIYCTGIQRMKKRFMSHIVELGIRRYGTIVIFSSNNELVHKPPRTSNTITHYGRRIVVPEVLPFFATMSLCQLVSIIISLYMRKPLTRMILSVRLSPSMITRIKLKNYCLPSLCEWLGFLLSSITRDHTAKQKNTEKHDKIT